MKKFRGGLGIAFEAKDNKEAVLFMELFCEQFQKTLSEFTRKSGIKHSVIFNEGTLYDKTNDVEISEQEQVNIIEEIELSKILINSFEDDLSANYRDKFLPENEQQPLYSIKRF